MQPLYYMLALTLAAGGAATPSVPEAPVAPAAAAAAVGVNAAAAAAVATANPAPQLALTMQGAVERALRTHPQVTAGQQGRLAARYGRYSTLGGMLPMVAVSDMQAWSHLNMHNLPAEFLSAATADRLRTLNAASNLLSISAAQPLLGLIGQSQRYRANVADERAADAQLEATRHDLSLEVRRQYLALFQARALGDTARASERALKEQVEDAEEKLKAGALATTDVLRRRSAAAAARQQAIAADAAEEIARAALFELLGLGEDEQGVQFAEPTVALDADPIPSLAQLRRTAMAQRPELQSARSQAHGSGLRARAEALKLLPEIDAQLAWMHVFADGGAGGRGHVDAYFVGLTAKWPIWQWGATVNGGRAAYAQAAQARARAVATERQLGNDVAQRHANYLAALGAVDAAMAEVSSAEEAYRVMVATLAVDAATTSDLLQTEAAQTQARMNLVRARYDLALAKVSLSHALGQEG